jgi:hypothetical protein
MSKADAKQQETVVVTGVSSGIGRAESFRCHRTKGLNKIESQFPAEAQTSRRDMLRSSATVDVLYRRPKN